MSAALLVADSGPLIALARLDLLALPSRLYREALVTATVWDEVTREPFTFEQRAHAAVRAGQFRVVEDPTELPQAVAGARLDPGERSAIALALERGAVVLVDEKRGRAVANGLLPPLKPIPIKDRLSVDVSHYAWLVRQCQRPQLALEVS